MKLPTLLSGLIAIGAATFLSVTRTHAQEDSALLDALVKKGVLSDQEAEDVRASEEKEYNSTAASKISLSSSIKTITFYGDMRLRYEMRDGTTPSGYTGNGGSILQTGDSEDRNAFRYRLRFGLKGTLYDNFFFGIRAATNPYYNRSGNVTLGHSDAAGPFGKAYSEVGLDQVYLGLHANEDFTLTGGQMPNPFYTTSMIWSDDLNPAGAAEQFDHIFNDHLEVFATAAQFVYQAAAGNGITNGLGSNTSFNNTFMYGEQIGLKYNLNKDTFFKAGVSMYTYSGTIGSTTGSGIQTVSGLYTDAPENLSNGSFNTTTGAAPSVVTGPGGGSAALTGAENNSPSYFNGPFVGAASAPLTNVSGINDLAVMEVPFEFDFKVGPGVHTTSSGGDPKDMKGSSGTETSTGWVLPMRIFGDFAYNFEADERANAARSAIDTLATTGQNNVGVTAAGPTRAAVASEVASPSFQGVLTSGKGFLDQAAFQFGVEAGQLKKKGDSDAKLYYQSTGYYAVDPNLIDADIFNGATNLQGVILAVSHNWTDGVSSTLRYAYAGPVNGRLATPSVNQDLQEGNIRQYNLFQADLLWKF